MTERAKFRKKPVVIEAIQWDGSRKCLDTLREFMKPNYPAWGTESRPDCLIIHTLEGDHRADRFDWIIKGVKGEFYPCKPDIFEQTYEPVANSPHPLPELTLIGDEEIEEAANNGIVQANMQNIPINSSKDWLAIQHRAIAQAQLEVDKKALKGIQEKI